MEPEEEKIEVLIRVLMALFPNAPFNIDVLAAKILEGLGLVGWTLQYDPEYTAKHIRDTVEAYQTAHPTPTQFMPPQPPERLAGT